MIILIHWLISALAIMVAAFVLPGVTVGFGAALLTALVLGLLNAFVRPFLLLITLPINILTLGLFTFVLNGLLIWLASGIVPGFSVDGFGSAILFALVLMIVNIIFMDIVGFR